MERRLRVLEQIVMIPQFNASPGQFSPKLGTAGTTVTLYGKNFNIGTVVVRFGTIAAALAAAPTPTEITAIVPGGVSGPVKVSVETSGGTAVSVDNFTVLGGGGSGDPPAFAAAPGEFSPKVGSISSSVTLFGSHFNEPGLIVKFGAVIASVSSFTASQINTSVPGGVAGAIKISVTTNFGTATSVDSFTVL
jgi:hypothetical protein